MDHRIKLPDEILCFPLISHFSYVILFSIHILKGKTMDKKPNIVIIMADQLRYDMINKQYTPNISALADNSVVFQRAYCASPLCVPARGSFFTGNYPNVSGSIINPWDDRDKAFGYVKAGTPNLFSLLENTYDSWHVGKQHFLTQEYKNNGPSPNTHLIYNEKAYSEHLERNGQRRPGGPDFMGITPEMTGGRFTQKKQYSIPATGCYEGGFEHFFDGYFLKGALEAIQRRDPAKPFMLNTMFLAPHPPFDIPNPWFDMYQTAAVPANVGRWYDGQSPLQLYNLTGFIGTRYTRSDWAQVWRVYAGLVSLLDECVGQIIQRLKEENIFDDTLIIFTSDHGEMLGSHMLWQKMCMYEESVRTPLLFKLPKNMQVLPKTIAQPVSAVDILPTICEIIGIQPPAVCGTSRLPLIKGEGQAADKDIYIQFDGNGARGNFSRCVIRENYKLIVDLFQNETFFSLYDIEKDRQEMQNLAFDEEYSKITKTLTAQLRRHMRETNDLLSIPRGAFAQFKKMYTK